MPPLKPAHFRPLKIAAIETSNEDSGNRQLGELFFSFEFLAEFAVTIDSFAGSEIVQLEKLAEFDFTFAVLAFMGSGSALGPLERLFAGLDLNDPIASDGAVTKTSILADGKTKEVSNCHPAQTPEQLYQLVKMMYEISKSELWIKDRSGQPVLKP